MQPEDITLDDLLARFTPEFSPWVAIGQRIGADALCCVMEELGSQHVHVPTPEYFHGHLFRAIRDDDIRSRFRGNNYDELSDDYGLSPRQIRRIVHGNKQHTGEA